MEFWRSLRRFFMIPNARTDMTCSHNLLRTPEHIIASRKLHIEERKRTLARHGLKWGFRQAVLDEIKTCQDEIERAELRLKAGMSAPYYP